MKRTFFDFFSLSLAAVCFGVSLNVFLLPASVVLGGFTGVASMLNLVFGVPVGVVVIILNIPFIVANAKFYGKSFTLRTLLGIFATSAASDLSSGLEPFCKASGAGIFISGILGGVYMGFACGLMFARGFTTGGTDLVAFFLKLRFENISIGRLILLTDGIIAIICLAVFGRGASVLPSFITIGVGALMIDVTYKHFDNSIPL